jgi:hypothetical protein
LLLLADKVPSSLRKRIQQQPDEFRRLAELDQKSLENLVKGIDSEDNSARAH